jgi:D-alanyl-D-alanine carboxypeptidase (penicillin-binding protein 5/6)
MARYGFQDPVISEAVSTRKYFLDSRTVNKKDLAVFSRCKFLRDYAGADGAKSGYVKQAGYCLVASATRGGWRLVCAVLKSDNAGRDTAAAMDYGFANYEPYTVARANTTCAGAEIRGGAQATVAAEPVRDLRVAVPKTGAQVTTRLELLSLEAPIKKGANLGKLIASVNGTRAAAVELRAAEDVGISVARRAWWWMKSCGLLFAVLLVGRRYGAATAKNPRRRRRGVTSALRSFDRYR